MTPLHWFPGWRRPTQQAVLAVLAIPHLMQHVAHMSVVVFHPQILHLSFIFQIAGSQIGSRGFAVCDFHSQVARPVFGVVHGYWTR